MSTDEGEITYSNEELEQILAEAEAAQRGAGATSAPSPAASTAGDFSIPGVPGGVGVNIPPEVMAQGGGAQPTEPGAGLTIQQIEAWTGRKVASISQEPAYIDVPDPATGGLTKKKAENPDKTVTRITFADGTYLQARPRTGPNGATVYEITNSGDAFKTPAGGQVDTPLEWAKFLWQKKKEQLQRDYDDRKITLDEAKQDAIEYQQRLSNLLAERGQDVTMRGQDMSYASQMGKTDSDAALESMKYMVPAGTAQDLADHMNAIRSGTPYTVKPRTMTPPFNPATVGVQVASQLLGMSMPTGAGAPSDPNTFQTPALMLPEKPAGVVAAATPPTLPQPAPVVPTAPAYTAENPYVVRAPSPNTLPARAY